MLRAASGGRVGVESSRLKTSRVEPSESGRVERFAGRLRAFDPKCTVGAREVEEAEETKAKEKGRSRSSCGPANWVRCARIVVRGSLSGRKPNIVGVRERVARLLRDTLL